MLLSGWKEKYTQCLIESENGSRHVCWMASDICFLDKVLLDGSTRHRIIDVYETYEFDPDVIDFTCISKKEACCDGNWWVRESFVKFCSDSNYYDLCDRSIRK